MADLNITLRRLREERSQIQDRLGRLDVAIAALEKVVGNSSGLVKRAGRKRKLSEAARARISAAQKARWAKVRQQKAAAKERRPRAS